MKFQNLISGISNRVFKYVNERRGWSTSRKIIVIESDDWGAIRTPDMEVYKKSIQNGINLDKSIFGKYDSLASNEDFEALYDVLLKHKDMKGNYPIITANTIMANPDFIKIKESNFEKYYFEPFTETLKKYPNRNFKIWQEGINKNIFFPQLHGREHLNINRWMKSLQSGCKATHFAFDNNYFGISEKVCSGVPNILPALDYDSDEGLILGNQSIIESIHMFKQVFGYSPQSFIGPNYYWHDQSEKYLAQNDIKYLQGTYTQRLPKENYKYHYLGEKNIYNQIYLIRNVTFEPASSIEKDWIRSTILEIEKSIRLKKPIIISMHRVNFIGSIFEENRKRNLYLFDKLLSEIIKRWPDIEFMNSVQLGSLISNDLKKV